MHGKRSFSRLAGRHAGPLCAALATAAALLIAPVPASAASYGRTHCDRDRGAITTTLRQGSTRRRVHLRHVVGTGENTLVWVARSAQSNALYFACWKASGRGSYIGSSGVARTLRNFSLAGRYVAFRIQKSGAASYDEFRSFDVRRGHVLRDSGRLTGLVNRPSQLVLALNGAIGWLQGTVVGAADANGSRTLAAGSGLSELAVAGRTLYWLQNGVPHSTPLV